MRQRWGGVVLVAVACMGCAGSVDQQTRPFHLGFTPFPHDISIEAVEGAYTRLAKDADMVSYHLDNGVPWPESLAQTPFSKHVQDDWDDSLRRKPAGHKVYVSLTPVAISRDRLAPYRGTANEMPLPAPWDGYAFDHPDVKKAFTNYALRAIDHFKPDFLNFGIEVNLVKQKAPGKWGAYMELHRHVYAALKRAHPKLPVFVSMTAPDLIEGYNDADHATQSAAYRDVMPYVDVFAVSHYPYMTRFLGDCPPDMFDRIDALAQGKPIAIAETGMIAEDLVLKEAKFTIPSNEAKQEKYIRALMEHAGKANYLFVNNFVSRDYDALAKKIGESDLVLAWRDTGLYDQDGVPRPALAPWRQALGRPFRRL